MPKNRVCTVAGKDHMGVPVHFNVEAETLFEAAAMGLYEITREGGVVTDVTVIVHEPKTSWTVTPDQLYEWAGERGEKDGLLIQSIKRKFREELKPKSDRQVKKEWSRKRNA